MDIFNFRETSTPIFFLRSHSNEIICPTGPKHNNHHFVVDAKWELGTVFLLCTDCGDHLTAVWWDSAGPDVPVLVPPRPPEQSSGAGTLCLSQVRRVHILRP